MFASTIVSALEPGPALPFQDAQGDDGPSLADLIDSFIDVRGHEVTAVLAALAALVTDDVLRQHICRELDRRGGPRPAGLDPLEPLSVDRTVAATHVLEHVGTGLGASHPWRGDEIICRRAPSLARSNSSDRARHQRAFRAAQGPTRRTRTRLARIAPRAVRGDLDQCRRAARRSLGAAGRTTPGGPAVLDLVDCLDVRRHCSALRPTGRTCGVLQE